jgi:hypothetical protein
MLHPSRRNDGPTRPIQHRRHPLRSNNRPPNPLGPKKGSDPFSKGLTHRKRGLTPFLFGGVD